MELRYISTALEQIGVLPQDVQRRILDKLHFYARQERPLKFAEHLTGYNVYRFRIGMYRVFCEIREEKLYILSVKKRDEAYRGL